MRQKFTQSFIKRLCRQGKPITIRDFPSSVQGKSFSRVIILPYLCQRRSTRSIIIKMKRLMKKMMMIMVMMMTIVISTSGKVMTNKPDNKRSNVQVIVAYDNPNGSFRISAVRPNPPCKGHIRNCKCKCHKPTCCSKKPKLCKNCRMKMKQWEKKKKEGRKIDKRRHNRHK